MREKLTGIEGLDGTEPIGAVLTIGTRGPNGAPTDRDRFYYKLPMAHSAEFASARGGYKSLQRDEHPGFDDYHALPPERRRMVHGFLIHQTQAEAFEINLAAQMLPKPYEAHPKKAPACEGNGKQAYRFYGKLAAPEGVVVGEDGYGCIVCPGRACEYQQGDKPACKPRGRILFRLVHDGRPMMLVKFSTQSWHSVKALLGLFEHVEREATQLGLKQVNFYGLPFTITLGSKTKAGSDGKPGSNYPVINVSPVGDLIKFLLRQDEQIQQVLEASKRAALPPPAITDPAQQDPQEVAADFEDIGPGPEGAEAPTVPVERVERSAQKAAALQQLSGARGKGR